MSDTDGVEEVVARRPMRERPQREVHRTERQPDVVIESGDEISPEEALAESRRLLEASDRQRQSSERQAREAERRAAEAQAQAQQAIASRATDRQTVVSSAIEAARSEQGAAQAAYAQARTEGDIPAETAALAAMTAAAARLETATRELDWLKSQPAQQQQSAAPAQANRPSPEAQRWIDDHPAYKSDRTYRAVANDAHVEAIQAGYAAGSQSYIDHIERVMTETYGDGHGQIGEQHVPPPHAVRRSDAAPPSRRTSLSGGNNGYKPANIADVGTIHYQDRPDGSRSIKMTTDQRTMFEEFANICKMDLNTYVNEQIQAAKEVAAGGRGDVIRGEGAKYE
jgi:hypothetical protein